MLTLAARIRSIRPRAVVFLVALLLALAASGPQATPSAGVVISQVYGGGGNANAPFQNDFVELFNRGTSPVSLAGLSIQYASATGTGFFAANSPVALSGSVAPGQYFLVKLAGGATGAVLPSADATGAINMSATAGKVALVNSATGLTCNGSAGQPCSPAQLALIVDLVGYGGSGASGANFFETAPAPSGSNTTALIRLGNGCTETDNNSADVVTGAPAPRNTASPFAPCLVDTPPTVSTR
jgi:predicted extracellular nuclease